VAETASDIVPAEPLAEPVVTSETEQATEEEKTEATA
jgi:hypothetical protein